MVLLRIPKAVHPMTGIDGIKYQAIDGEGGRGVFDLAKVEIEFSVVSDRGECQLPDAFYLIKKYRS